MSDMPNAAQRFRRRVLATLRDRLRALEAISDELTKGEIEGHKRALRSVKDQIESWR